jgi:hypothetical protein
MHFGPPVRKPLERRHHGRRLRVTNGMATPPITEKTLEIPRRRRWLGRRALARTAWLAADVVAIGTCATLAARALL